MKVCSAVFCGGSKLRVLIAGAACVSALLIACSVQAQTEEQSVRQIVMLQRLNKYQQSLALAEKLLVARPQDCRLWSLRGMALDELQKPVEAERSFKKELEYCPEDLVALEGAAQVAYERREPDTVGLLDRVLKVYPDDVTAHAMLASVYRAEGECLKALPHFEASTQVFVGHPKYQQAYAFCLAATGHYPQAADNYKHILGVDQDEAVRFNLALVQWKMHEARAALATLKPLLANTHQETVLVLGAKLAEEMGDTPAAVKLLRAAIIQQPKNLANYLEFAQIAYNHHSAQVGIDMLNAGLMQLPNAAQIYLARGVLEVQLSRFDSAIADFKKAHKLAPQLSLAMDAMGIIDSQQYQQTAALELYRREVKLHPDDSLLQYLYAEALSGANAGQEAIVAAETSVRLEPNYAPARDLLALLYLRTNNPHKALTEAQAALKINPADDVALYHEIMAQRQLGRTAEVQKLVKELIVIRKKNTQEQKAEHRYVLEDEVAH